jgi:hypothetical protein
MKILDD